MQSIHYGILVREVWVWGSEDVFKQGGAEQYEGDHG